MAYFGPKSISANGDSVYYRVPEFQLKTEKGDSLNSNELPSVYLIGFINESYKTQGYNLKGIIEYFHLKQKDIEEVDLIIAHPSDSAKHLNYRDTLQLKNKKVTFVSYNRLDENKIISTYFPNVEKQALPFFIVLIDANRNIRGYYNPKLVAEVKKMIQEFKHLRLKESKKELQEQNKLEQKKKI